jgi:hypothetical protein
MANESKRFINTVFEADEVDSSLARLSVFIVQNSSRDPCLPFAKGCIREPKNSIVSGVFEHNVKWWWGWKRDTHSLVDPSPSPVKDSNPVSFSEVACSTVSVIEGRVRQSLLVLLQP